MSLDGLDDEVSVKGHADDDGNADVVCVQGGPAVNTTVWSDLPLLAGDRIVNSLESWDDPDTGQTLYLADVEWQKPFSSCCAVAAGILGPARAACRGTWGGRPGMWGTSDKGHEE